MCHKSLNSQQQKKADISLYLFYQIPFIQYYALEIEVIPLEVVSLCITMSFLYLNSSLGKFWRLLH